MVTAFLDIGAETEGKMNTFDRVFKEIFGNGLKEHGFCAAQGSVFLKLINECIVQFIMPKKLRPCEKGTKCFTVEAGMMSIYCEGLGKAFLERYCRDLAQLSYYSGKKHDNKDLNDFPYNDENASLIVQHVYDLTEEYILPLFGKVKDITDYKALCRKIFVGNLRYADSFSGDSLLLIKTKDREDFMDMLNESYNEEKAMIDSGLSGCSYEEAYRLLYNGIIKTIPEPRDKVFADPVLFSAAVKEADERAEQNLEYLHSLGL